MLRVSTTIVSPTATTTTIETFCAMSCQFETVRKFVARAPKKTITTKSASTIPISRSLNAAAASSCGFMARTWAITPPPPARPLPPG